jgi:hypothetical protein
MSKTKYGIEYKQPDGYRVVDAVDVASYQKPVSIVSTTTAIVDVDIIKSNFFIIDINPSTLSQSEEEVPIRFLNASVGDIFYLLIIEPYAVRNPDFDTHQTMIYRDGPINLDDEQIVGRRREMLLSFKVVESNNNLRFMALSTPWFFSALLEVFIEFVVVNPSDDPMEDAQVELTPTGAASFFNEIKYTNERGECEFAKPRGLGYDYRVIKMAQIVTGTITAAQIEEEEFIEINVTHPYTG